MSDFIDTTGNILVTQNLHKSFKFGSSEIKVLKGINLEVRAGQIVAIVGPSGVGKSTLLHILGGLDRPSKGKVFIDQTNVFDFDDKKLAYFRNSTVGFVFQFHNLMPEFTALENVMMPSMISGQPKNKMLQRAKFLLSEVRLEHREDHRPSELSGGEMQRVAVARALMNNPKIVLADEPSGNLDEASSKSLHNLLWDLSRKDQRTFIIVTHNPDLAENADKVIEIFDGCIKREQINEIV